MTFHYTQNEFPATIDGKINYFEVLDKTIQKLISNFGISFHDQSEMSNLKHRWMTLRRQWRDSLFDYSDDYTKISYLFTYVALHAALIQYVFEKDSSIRDYLLQVYSQNDIINLAIFGCRPGSEVLGLAKWLESGSFDCIIYTKCFLVDQDDGWRKFCKSMLITLRSKAKMNCDLQFHKTDLTDITISRKLLKSIILKIAVYIIDYLFSEIFQDKTKLIGLIEIIREIARRGEKVTKIVVIDRNQSEVRTRLESIFNNISEISFDGPNYFRATPGQLQKLLPKQLRKARIIVDKNFILETSDDDIRRSGPILDQMMLNGMNPRFMPMPFGLWALWVANDNFCKL